jgi:sulfate/thiosulfate transport system permease protein
MALRQPNVLPGFGLTIGFTTFFLSALVLLPLAALVLQAASMHWRDFLHVVFSARAIGSYRLSFGASFLAATINLVFGFIIAWTLVRYEFPGRKLIDALIDMPFALLHLDRRHGRADLDRNALRRAIRAARAPRSAT